MEHSSTEDSFQLKRFLDAQEGVYPQAFAELRAGSKQSHWMWFIFPQIDGLGSSGTARFYAIKSRDEAQAYLEHPVLGSRLRECCEALLQVPDNNATRILGCPDDLKLRSSMTLFAAVAGNDPVFHKILAKFYGGLQDARTLELLGQ
jgi:uncharacterized protein (DUF1810 family)